MRTDSNSTRHTVIKRAVQSLPALCALVACLSVSAAPEKAASSSAKKPGATKTAKPMVSGKPVVYEFGASYCVPCKVFAPTFQKIKEQYAGKAMFQNIDIEDEKQKSLVDRFKVVSVPKFVIVDGAGKLKYEHEGALEEKVLTAEINKVVGK